MLPSWEQTRRFLHVVSSCAKLSITQRSARSRSHGYVPIGLPTFVFQSFFNTLITSISKYVLLFAMKQMMSLSNIVLVRGGSMDTVDYGAASIYSDMRFHTKIPLVTFLRRTHFWITATATVFR